MQPLNFLCIITDQHRPDHTGFGGNRTVQAPNLDQRASTSDARLTRDQGAAHGELFALASDPGEMSNLHADPEGRELRFHLTEKLARLDTRHDDSGRLAVHGG